VRGALTYRAQVNSENPLGTIQSIEHTIRSLDRRDEEEQREIQRQEKALAEYKEQLDRPFEHEKRLKELLVKQTQLNAALDLDKNERQVALDDPQTEKEPAASTFASRVSADRAAEMAL
jgi:chromosome segregation ATPase